MLYILHIYIYINGLGEVARVRSIIMLIMLLESIYIYILMAWGKSPECYFLSPLALAGKVYPVACSLKPEYLMTPEARGQFVVK